MKLTNDSFPRARHGFFYCLILFLHHLIAYGDKYSPLLRRNGICELEETAFYSILVYKHHIRGNAYFFFVLICMLAFLGGCIACGFLFLFWRRGAGYLGHLQLRWEISILITSEKQ